MKRRTLICSWLVIAAWCAEPVALADQHAPQGGRKQETGAPPLVPIPGARVSKSGLLVGGQPTRQHLLAIREAGYRTIISLRARDEPGAKGERTEVERLEMTFVSIPVPGASGLTIENARALSKALDRRHALPAVVHCGSGQRASALLGLKAFVVDRVSPKAAIKLARDLGMTKLETALSEVIAEICKIDKSRGC